MAFQLTYDWDRGGIQPGWLLGVGDEADQFGDGRQYVRCGQFYIVPFEAAFVVVADDGSGVTDGVEALCDTLADAGRAVRQLEALYKDAEAQDKKAA